MEKKSRFYRIYRGRVAGVMAIGTVWLIVSMCWYLFFCASAQLQTTVAEAHISVVVKDDSSIDPKITTQSITQIAGVKEAQYIDSTLAQKEFSTQMGVDITSILGVGAVPSSFIVTVDATEGMQMFENVKSQLASQSWVEGISYEQTAIDRLVSMGKWIEMFAYAFGLVLGFLSLVVLYIIAKMSVGVMNNLMIEMPESYFRKMMIRRSMVDGVVGGSLAAIVLTMMVYVGDSLFPGVGLPFENLLLIASSVLLGGFVVNLLFTYISTLQISIK